MKVVLVMFKQAERREFPLVQPRTVVGRKNECGLRIPTGDVSREHCELTLSDAELTVRDLGSSNGTYVNGKRVAQSPLKAGDKLSVGPVTFVVQVDGKPATIKPSDAAPPAPAVTAATDDEDVLDLDDVDFDVDEALGVLDDDDDDDEPPTRIQKKK